MSVDTIRQQLEVDVIVLEAVLQRHRASHGRTLYFRRMAMVARALRRYAILGFWERLEAYDSAATQFGNQRKRKQKRKGSTSKIDEQWEVTSGGLTKEADSEKLELKERLVALQQDLAVHFPEILSRIEHASNPLFVEVSRGFFLPFCTVSLGALARIRVLVMQLGKSGLSKLTEVATEDNLQFLQPSSKWLEETLPPFVELEGPSQAETKEAMERRRAQVLSKLGLTPSLASLRSKSDNHKDNLQDDDAVLQPTMVMEDSDTESTPRQARLSQASQSDDDDLGEALVNEEETNSLVETKKRARKSGKKKRDVAAGDSVDQNLAFLSTFKSKNKKEKAVDKKKGKDDKKSKKRKDKGQDSKPTKKKKKKDKGDFFDALFT